MRRLRAWGPGLLLVSPSLVLLGIFVYGFLGWNVRVSFTDWRGPAARRTTTSGCENYRELLDDERFQLTTSAT